MIKPKPLLVFLFFVMQLPGHAAPASPSIAADYQEMEVLAMPAVEQDALYAVMEAIAGDVDWRSTHPRPCAEDVWPGLVCEQGKDALFHVTRLDFGYKPNPSCGPNASIPIAITKLSHIRSLFILQCFTSTNMSIPTFLVKLAPTLQELSIRANSALVGGIPFELSELSSLTLLSLSQNSLYGHIPPEFSKLSALQNLDLSNNLLSGELPPDLGRLHNLVILDVSANSITGPIPASLGSLSKLQKLDLSFNNLVSTVPRELGRLGSLQFLAINDNSISGPYPAEMESTEALQYLVMGNNPMKSTLPSFLGTFRSLMAVGLSNSGYYGEIPTTFGGLSNLTVLSLDCNDLTGSIPMELGQLPHIYQMNLSQNQLSGAVPFTPDFVKKLGRNLDISGNSGLCSAWSSPQMISSSGSTIGLCTNHTSATSSRASTATRREGSFSAAYGTLVLVYYLFYYNFRPSRIS